MAAMIQNDDKNFNNSNSGEFRAEPVDSWDEATQIGLIKIFAINLHIPSQPFLGHPLWFLNFFTLATLNRAALFYSLSVFEQIVYMYQKSTTC